MPKKTGGKSKKPVRLHVVKPNPQEPTRATETNNAPLKAAPIIIKPSEIPKPEAVKITVPKLPEALPQSPKMTSSPVTTPKQPAIPEPPRGIGAMELLIYIFVAFCLGGVCFGLL